MRISRREFVRSSALGLAGASIAARVAAAKDSPRPRLELTTREKFDARSIPAYAGNHAEVYRYIDSHQDSHLENLRRWLRQPSVSAQGVGIEEMAKLVRDDLKALGCKEAEVVKTSGHPGVWGWLDAGAPRTLLVYMMYDVQPVEPEAWRVPPFAGELVDHEHGSVLMARGATNQKGPERAFLNAVESILAVEKKLPVNLMITAEGEEELGSPHYPEIVGRYEERLRTASGAVFPSHSQNAKGTARLTLGVKGILYVELEAKGGPGGGPTRAEVHGSLKAIVDSPVWRLNQALASLVSPDGNTILVPGYYDSVRPPSDEEQRLVNAAVDTWEEDVMKKQLAVDRWIDGMSREQALLRLLFDTTLNVDGIWAGYTGEGVKTILPHKATAKVDTRLVPDQRPEQALALIREHLDRQGFRDIEIRTHSSYPPAQSSVATPLARAVISVFNKHDHAPEVWPRASGSAPFYQFTERLGLPIVPLGFGHGAGAHAPDEYMVIRPKQGSRIAGLAEIEKGYVDLLHALSVV